MADGSSTYGTGLSGIVAYNGDPASNAQNMLNQQYSNYQQYMQNLPQYQNQLNNQTTDQGLNQYQNQKQAIDQNANARGLLYSGLKTGAESSAATNAANGTANQISQNNQNLVNQTNAYGQQVAQNAIGNYQGQVGQSMSQYQNQVGQYNQNAQQVGGLLSGAAGIGAMAMLSDEEEKENIENADDAADDLADDMEPKSFSYKEDPEKKKQLGVIAQDVEKSPLGKSIIVETPKGKGLDIAKALSAVLAVQGTLNKRMKKVEAS